MRSDEFDYILPPELIAQHPPPRRDSSRMLAMERSTGKCEVRSFKDILDYLSPGDCAVINNSRVIRARLYGLKNGDGARIELLLVRELPGGAWETLVRPGKRARAGTRIRLTPATGTGEVEAWASILGRDSDGSFTVSFDSALPVPEILESYGHIPLPPYIKRGDNPSDASTYQTIYSRIPGSVAAPTAGLHFSNEILAAMKDKGVAVAELTLHVGPGTFLPVSAENIEEHRMHSEFYRLPEEAAEAVNGARGRGKKILAVGTTTVRVLESCADAQGRVRPGSGETSIFLHPPRKPRVPDMLLTNFHLPKSTLIMLVCTFAEREKVLAAYELAKSEGFRFYSYGDCMLLH